MIVDDDPQVLAGMRNIFYRDRHRWQTLFATSGEDALAQMLACPVDLICSDMRMPRMDGVALLACVRDKFPLTRRIMLSGSADQAELLRGSAAVDELLNKPCDAKTLRATFERWLAKSTGAA